MISRFLEKKVEITGREIVNNADNALELEYYLLECDPSDSLTSGVEKDYGVEIIEKECGSIVDSKVYANIYPNRWEAEKLLRLLSNNSVTPVTLPYILDDILGNE